MGYDSGAFYSYSLTAQLVSQSACHSEVQSIDHTVRMILHFLEVLYFLKVYERGQHDPVKVFADSASSIDLCNMLKVSPRSSAMNMRINFKRECINRRLVTLHFVPSALNVSDMLTKALAEQPFSMHACRLLHGFGGYDAFCMLLEQTVLTVDHVYLAVSDSETMEVC